MESLEESWNDTVEKLHKLFKKHLGIENISVERTHEVDRKGRTKNGQRAIVGKMLDFKIKQKILENAKKLKDTNFFIKEDFSRAT